MKYFIGHLIGGEFAAWHTTITNDIAEKFNTWKIHDVCPSHLTIFSEFEIGNIESVSNVIESVLLNIEVENYLVSGFDHFVDRAVFAKIETATKVTSFVQELKKRLEQIPGIQKDKHLVWKPHATVAFRLPPEDITKIWNYVIILQKPDFIVPFDNITIFKFNNLKWVVEKTFKIESKKW